MHIELILAKSILIIPLEIIALGVSNPLSYLFLTQQTCDKDISCFKGACKC